jgi:hypothetical protein
VKTSRYHPAISVAVKYTRKSECLIGSGAARAHPAAIKSNVCLVHYIQRCKGETVTKPIELGVKKADLSKQARIDKTEPAKGRKEVSAAADQHCEAEVMTLAPAPPRKTSAKPEIVRQIGQCLGRVYNDVLKQPVPDRFLDLLQALEAAGPTQPDRQALPASPSEPHIKLEAHAAGGRKKERK